MLNSRTYNIALETSCSTCCLHRYIRDEERKYVARVKKEKQPEKKEKKRPLVDMARVAEKELRKRENQKSKEVDVYEFGEDTSDTDAFDGKVSNI